MVLPILDFRILASRVRMRACAGSWAWARGRVHGGGRASTGVRACLRFKRVLNRPAGELGGGFQGSLFAGRVMIAERG